MNFQILSLGISIAFTEFALSGNLIKEAAHRYPL